MIVGSIVLFFYSCNIGIDEKIVLVPEIKKVSIGSGSIIEKYDFEKDTSITKYVDNKISFNDKNYIPETLLQLKGEYLIDTKNNQKVRKITLENINKLSENFYNTFGEKLKIISAYRSYNYQKGIKDRGCSDAFCAKAGFSEHQSGLAIDLWEATNEDRFKDDEELKTYFDWMKDNGNKYGFTNTYQKGVEIDGYEVEPWHWRYVGIKLATSLKKQKLTFVEFYYKNNFK
ncbi:MAG: M15 family metallopeptidase [Candidatus Gracilibacteria bacterium]|nr:M15 family metallopeptidase [Candidatus Gracilibacteria bacterium]